jgi:hypothetical protein
MRIFSLIFIVALSVALVYSAGASIYRAAFPDRDKSYAPVELVRVEGKNCPLYFPKDQE